MKRKTKNEMKNEMKRETKNEKRNETKTKTKKKSPISISHSPIAGLAAHRADWLLALLWARPRLPQLAGRRGSRRRRVLGATARSAEWCCATRIQD